MEHPSSEATTPRTAKLVAVIDIGTTSIRMAIAEIHTDGSVRTLSNLTQAVNLGRDAFTEGMISRATIEQSVRVLASYRRVLREFQISEAEQIRVVATSAVREARNRLAFIDRVYIATGLQVEPIDEAEVNRITYLGVQPFLQAEKTLAKSQAIIVEIGGGSTEVLVVKNANVSFAHSYRLGSLRLRKQLESYRTSPSEQRKIMESQIRRTVDEIREQVTGDGSTELVAIGGDVRFAADSLFPDWDHTSLARVPLSALEDLTRRILRRSEDEIVRRYHLSFPDAETVGPALLAYVQLAHTFELQSVLVSNANLRDGLLQEMAARDAWSDEFRQQIVRSALHLGRKYDFDEPHARHVAELSTKLFQQLRQEHQLDAKHEILLHIAALLHEIGYYVNNRSMHKHSMYLIRNSELFGLGEREKLLVSLVARYHRRAAPQPTHEGYSALSRDDRVIVAKLAGILRLAVSLDESRSQRVRDFSFEIEDERVVITIAGVDDLALEQLALRQNGSLFEDIYGRQVLLRISRLR